MNAAIIAVGSELLTPTRMDTNSLFLTEKLNALGVEVVQKHIVGDHRERLESAIRYCLDHVELLILTGGLGPTEDDLTRESVSNAAGRALGYDRAIVEALEARFHSLGRKMQEINKRQAYVLEGAEILANPKGTAPGQFLRLASRQIIVLLPGPPGEMKPMVEAEFLPRLQKFLPPIALSTVTFRVTGMGESELDSLIAPTYKLYENPVTTILAKASDLTIHLRAQAPTQAEADALTAELAGKIEAILGQRIYSKHGEPLEQIVLSLLEERGQTIAVAESLTGGLLGSRFSAVPGASKSFVGGFITYTNAQKQTLLHVDPRAIAEFTEVSESVARQMACSAQQLAKSHWAVSLTGYAGPDGGSAENPVGTVYIGIAGPRGLNKAVRYRFPGGDRDRVRAFASQAALGLLRTELLAK
jgi:nicotinamide-nucleotide amidase